MEQPAELPQLLIERAEVTPHATAFEFFTPGAGLVALTYAELLSRARGAAFQIARQQGNRRQPVVLLFPPGIDYVVALCACFLAGAPAVPAYPPDPRRPEVSRARLARVMRDLGQATVLTTEAIRADWPEGLERPTAALLLSPAAGPSAELPMPAMAEVALIQYTSGSVTAPKGVIVRHAQLQHNMRAIASAMHVGKDSRALIWLPPYHDMGLIGGILTPLFVGFPVRLMEPFDFLKRPLSWLQQIAESGATVSGGPNFAYDLCVRRHRKSPGLPPLDLSRWRVAFNGSEPVRRRTMEAFAREFAPYGFDRSAFFPCYGLAEATLLVSGGHWDPAAPRDHVRCGKPLPDQRVVVVSLEDGRPVADGAEGEIWVAGPSVTDGYWGGREAGGSLLDGRRFLRTGDIGYLDGGELVVTGKLADVLVSRGLNYHAADIEEAAVADTPPLRPVAAAFMAERPHADKVVVVVEVSSIPDTLDELAAGVRQRVLVATGLVVDTLVVGPPGTVPRTSSGKVQRSLCRSRFVAGDYRHLSTAAAAGGADVHRSRR